MAIERLFIGEGVKEVGVKNFLQKELKRAGLAAITIQRTPLVTRIVLYCDRPALVIGRKGKNVKHITRVIEDNYNIEKPELEIKKVERPNLEPNIVAYRIASALERGMNSRKVGYKALQAIMRDGAKGAEIVLSGKLVGKGGRARSLKMKAGYMKKCGKPSLEQVMHGEMIATCKAGTIGVEVSIVPQNVHFPDEINILSPKDFEIEEEVVEISEADAKEKKKEEKKADAEKNTSEPKVKDTKASSDTKSVGKKATAKKEDQKSDTGAADSTDEQAALKKTAKPKTGLKKSEEKKEAKTVDVAEEAKSKSDGKEVAEKKVDKKATDEKGAEAKVSDKKKPEEKKE